MAQTLHPDYSFNQALKNDFRKVFLLPVQDGLWRWKRLIVWFSLQIIPKKRSCSFRVLEKKQ